MPALTEHTMRNCEVLTSKKKFGAIVSGLTFVKLITDTHEHRTIQVKDLNTVCTHEIPHAAI